MSTGNLFLRGFVVSLIGVGLVVAIGYALPLESVVDQFLHANWRYLAAAVIFGLATTVGRVARYCLFFPFRSQLPQIYVVSVYMRGLTYILPFRLGEPVSLYMLKRWGLVPTMSIAAPAWALFRLGDFLSRLVFLPPVFAFMLPNEANAAAWGVVALAASTCIAIVFLGTLSKRSIEILSRYLPRYDGRLAAILNELQLGLAKIKSRSRIAWSVAASLFIAASNIAVNVFALWALSLPISLATGTAIAVIAQAVSVLPFRPPLGIGLQESVWMGLLVYAGLDSEQAFAGALSVRATQIVVMTIETMIALTVNFVSRKSASEGTTTEQAS
jgi:uncharacterized membrane protein YbhN (UPF0104 family)